MASDSAGISGRESSMPSGGSCPPRCIRMWCCSTRALVNLRWHSGQEFWVLELGGRARWVARCDRRLPLVEKDRPQSLQGKGRSPRWVAWCRRSALGQLSTRRHTPHWLGARLLPAPMMPNDGSMAPARILAPLVLIPRAATISRVKFETEVEAEIEECGEAMT